MILGFGNNVVSSLASDITASQTTFSVLPGDGPLFSALLTSDFSNKSTTLKTYAKITLTDSGETAFEVCHLTAVSGDTLTVIRGQEGTAAKGWSLKDVVANFATRGSENQFVQIEQLQSGHYISGVAGGTANALTLELPATYFVNGATDWTLRTPIVVYPTQNNTGASTLQLTMGGRVLGTFKLYKGNKAELVANDILKGVGLICLLDSDKSFFNVSNPGAIYAGLGTAAFCDATTSTTDDTPGRVLKVGDRGLGLTGVVASNNFDFSTYEFAAGETLFINMPTAVNYPGDLSVLSGAYVYLHVTGIRDAAYDASFILAPHTGSGGIHFCKRSTDNDGSVGWFVNKLPTSAADVGAVPQYDTVLNVDLNTLDGTKPGRYLQPMDADALTEYHYPVNNAGSLDVIRNGANGQAGCTQEYRPFNTNVLYRRHSNIADSVVSWSDWNPEYSQENQPPYPVTSVNGMTGAVTIPAPDLSGYETIADANARFLQGCRLGAEIAINQDGFVTDGGMRWVRAPAGCVLTGMLDASLSPDTINNIDTVYARPEQQNMNGVWVTVSE
ncbi:pyocin knob domain-containing protein [Citrobacter braakii]|uniref:pyocin knob domain-containing protein n=1 Tax=Citrobacter braakii TaxID=57706 RepID=UPI00403924EA